MKSFTILAVLGLITTGFKGIVAAALAAPTPALKGHVLENITVVPNCQQVYWIETPYESACAEVLRAANVTLKGFRALNPAINDNCTNLWVNERYCPRGMNSTAERIVADSSVAAQPVQLHLFVTSDFVTLPSPTSINLAGLSSNVTTSVVLGPSSPLGACSRLITVFPTPSNAVVPEAPISSLDILPIPSSDPQTTVEHTISLATSITSSSSHSFVPTPIFPIDKLAIFSMSTVFLTSHKSLPSIISVTVTLFPTLMNVVVSIPTSTLDFLPAPSTDSATHLTRTLSSIISVTLATISTKLVLPNPASSDVLQNASSSSGTLHPVQTQKSTVTLLPTRSNAVVSASISSLNPLPIASSDSP